MIDRKLAHRFLAFWVGAFVLAVAGKVGEGFIASYQREKSHKVQSARRVESFALLNALYDYAKDHGGTFPTNLMEILGRLRSGTNVAAFGKTWEQALNDYVYVQPNLNVKTSKYPIVIFAEKLGHYKNREGGHIAEAAADSRRREYHIDWDYQGWVHWRYEKEYTNLLIQNGLSRDKWDGQNSIRR